MIDIKLYKIVRFPQSTGNILNCLYMLGAIDFDIDIYPNPKSVKDIIHEFNISKKYYQDILDINSFNKSKYNTQYEILFNILNVNHDDINNVIEKREDGLTLTYIHIKSYIIYPKYQLIKDILTIIDKGENGMNGLDRDEYEIYFKNLLIIFHYYNDFLERTFYILHINYNIIDTLDSVNTMFFDYDDLIDSELKFLIDKIEPAVNNILNLNKNIYLKK